MTPSALRGDPFSPSEDRSSHHLSSKNSSYPESRERETPVAGGHHAHQQRRSQSQRLTDLQVLTEQYDVLRGSPMEGGHDGAGSRRPTNRGCPRNLAGGHQVAQGHTPTTTSPQAGANTWTAPAPSPTPTPHGGIGRTPPLSPARKKGGRSMAFRTSRRWP